MCPHFNWISLHNNWPHSEFLHPRCGKRGSAKIQHHFFSFFWSNFGASTRKQPTTQHTYQREPSEQPESGSGALDHRHVLKLPVKCFKLRKICIICPSPRLTFDLHVPSGVALTITRVKLNTISRPCHFNLASKSNPNVSASMSLAKICTRVANCHM